MPDRFRLSSTRTPGRAAALWLGVVVALAGLVLTMVAAPVTANASGRRPAGTALGDERYRPQIHFTPEKNWMNDPNGLVYDRGTYHLFFQYNPSGTTWGNMSWGHATSPDLVHWTQQPLAIAGGAHENIFSGSVVVDDKNTSGFGTAANPPMVAIYTSNYVDDPVHGTVQAQSLAYSTDHGQTWTKYDGNPVLDRRSANFRDPKVFWYQGSSAASSYWVMTAVEAQAHQVLLYKSSDLKHWTALSTFGPAGAVGGAWECPDLFSLAVDGDTSRTKWVLGVNLNPGAVAGGSGGQYFVGNFDGTTFTADSTVGDGSPLPGRSIGDFDDGTYDGWTVANEPGNQSGGPFGSRPATGALNGQQTVSGFDGAGLINSFRDSDWSIGTVTSPTFTVDAPYLNFLMGGGNHPRVSDKLDNNPPPGDLLWNGFETPDGVSLADQGWTSTGDLAASAQPATVGGDYALGAKRVNTYETGANPGDDRTGTLTSPEFTLTKPYLDMLVGGGYRTADSGQTLAVELLVGGQVVRTLAGDDAGALNWKGWDVSQFAGQRAQLRVDDQATGAWGHLTLDNVVASDAAAVTRSDETTVNLVVDGKVVQSVTGTDSETLDWRSFDLRALQGKQAQVRVVDNNRYGWGHVLADAFSLSSQQAHSRLESDLWLDWGKDYYASVSFNNLPGGRRVMLGWMNNWDYANLIPTSPWRSAMSLPREIGLTQTSAGPRLTQRVVPEVDQLGGRPSWSGTARMSNSDNTLPCSASGDAQRIDVSWAPGSATDSGIGVLGDATHRTRIGYDATSGRLYVDRTQSGDSTFFPAFASRQEAPVQLDSHGVLALRIYVDRSSVEVFTADGKTSITDQVFPPAGATQVSAYATGATSRGATVTVTPLKKAMFTG